MDAVSLYNIRQNNTPAFGFKIKFINQSVFNKKVQKLSPKRHEVLYPWTPKDMKTGKKIFTKGIMDCIAGGVFADGKFKMYHLGIYNQAKAKKFHQKGFNIKDVERRILEGVNLKDNNLHGIIFGGFQLDKGDKYNIKKINQIQNIYEKNNIPYSIIAARKDVHYFGNYSMLYENKSDTLYITNNLTNSPGLNGKGKEIDIKENSIEYNIYENIKTKYGMRYNRKRMNTNLEEYFKSQFRLVKLSKFDEFA